MCDRDEAELSEYLLWTEAARANARAERARPTRIEPDERRSPVVGTAEAAEA